jgi:hypothetical protein
MKVKRGTNLPRNTKKALISSKHLNAVFKVQIYKLNIPLCKVLLPPVSGIGEAKLNKCRVG